MSERTITEIATPELSGCCNLGTGGSSAADTVTQPPKQKSENATLRETHCFNLEYNSSTTFDEGPRAIPGEQVRMAAPPRSVKAAFPPRITLMPDLFDRL